MKSAFENRTFFLIIPVLLWFVFAFKQSISGFEESNDSPSALLSSIDSKTDELEFPVIPEGLKDEPRALDFKTILHSQTIDARYFLKNTFTSWHKLIDKFIGENSLIGQVTVDTTSYSVRTPLRYYRRGFSPGRVFTLVELYGDIIVRECDYYNLDWRLVLAMIKQESAFIDTAVSRAGAYGFMQIMPGTGAGLQRELQLPDTKAPVNNLIAGIYYYATLVASFEFVGEDKYKFALAAYNAGLGRVIDAMTITAHYGGDYKVWDEVKEAYPYLASSEESVHAEVWQVSKRPPYGALNNWREPYYYVESIMYFFEEYKKIFESNLPEDKKQKQPRRKRN